MNKEKIVLSMVAILLGLFVAGGAFYIYQMTRTINDTPSPITLNPTPTSSQIQNNKNFIVVESPKEEEVFSKRIIDIKGKTPKDATILISSATLDQVVRPNENGDFTLTHTLEDGVNILRFTAVFSDGTEQVLNRTVTSTEEEF